MVRNNGTRFETCRYCGKKYRRTNMMVVHGYLDVDGRVIRDTHQRACARKLGICYRFEDDNEQDRRSDEPGVSV